ncbi:type II-A CRISPR-associated protein Csn2 [Fusobacterium animalis]
MDFEEKNIFSLIVENKKVYRKIIEDLVNNSNIEDGNIIFSKNDKLIIPEKEIFVFSDYFSFDINKFVLTKYYKELKNLSENEFLNETLKIKDILKDYINKLIENNYSLKFEDDLDVGQILKAFSIKFERNEDLLLNLFEWIKILNEILGYEILFFINLGNFLSEDELVEFSKFIVYNKYKVVFLENFYRSKLSDSDNLIIIDNDLCEIF